MEMYSIFKCKTNLNRIKKKVVYESDKSCWVDSKFNEVDTIAYQNDSVSFNINKPDYKVNRSIHLQNIY